MKNLMEFFEGIRYHRADFEDLYHPYDNYINNDITFFSKNISEFIRNYHTSSIQEIQPFQVQGIQSALSDFLWLVTPYNLLKPLSSKDSIRYSMEAYRVYKKYTEVNFHKGPKAEIKTSYFYTAIMKVNDQYVKHGNLVFLTSEISEALEKAAMPEFLFYICIQNLISHPIMKDSHEFTYPA